MLLLAYHINPQSPAILYCLAKAFIDQGQSERALGVINELEKLEDVRQEKEILHSRALWSLGEKEKARRILKGCVESRRNV